MDYAVKMDRRGVGIELKESYWLQAVENCRMAEIKDGQFYYFNKEDSDESTSD